MSNGHLKIPIHVKPYVKKYIVANYSDAMLISIKDPVSLVLYSFLHKENIPFRTNPEAISKRFSELTDTIYLLLHRRDRYKHGLFIHQENQLLINNYFEQEILKRIFQQCEAYRMAKAALIKAIGDFCEEHNIDFSQDQYEAYAKLKIGLVKAIEDFCDQNNIELHKDLSLEAILKAEYRHRQQAKSRKKGAVLSGEKNDQNYSYSLKIDSTKRRGRFYAAEIPSSLQ